MHPAIYTCHFCTSLFLNWTHRYSTPSALEPGETLASVARLGADPAACTGWKVALNPVMIIDHFLLVSVRSTVFTVVEGISLAVSVCIVPAHCVTMYMDAKQLYRYCVMH